MHYAREPRMRAEEFNWPANRRARGNLNFMTLTARRCRCWAEGRKKGG